MVRKTLLLAIIAATAALPQSKPNASAHWEGSVTLPDREMAVTVDLAQNASGDWTGSLNLPVQNIVNFPLSKIAVKENAVTFAMLGIPGDPTFNGKLSDDGKSLAGEFKQGGGTLPFQFKRISEANVVLPPKSTPIDEKLLGTWEGILSAGATKLHIVLKFAKAADGTATAVLDSPDQNVNGIAVTTVTQEGSKLNLDIKTIAATFAGEVNADQTEIAGQLAQAGKSLALSLKKAAEKK